MSDQPPWDPFSQQAQPNDQEQYPQGQPQSGQPQYPQAQPQFGPQPFPQGQQPFPQGQPQFPQGQPQFGQQQFGQQPPQFGQQFPYSQPPQGPYGPMPQLPFGPPGGFRPRRTWRRRHTVFSVVGSLVGLFVVIGVLGTVSSRGNQAPVASAASASAAALAPAAASPAGAANVAANTVATFTGSGTENTAKFTVKATWKLQYSFNCSNFGQTGNFAVLEDGGQDISLTINDVALSRSGSAWAYNDAGTHYLEIASQCDWKVKVLD